MGQNFQGLPHTTGIYDIRWLDPTLLDLDISAGGIELFAPLDHDEPSDLALNECEHIEQKSIHKTRASNRRAKQITELGKGKDTKVEISRLARLENMVAGLEKKVARLEKKVAGLERELH